MLPWGSGENCDAVAVRMRILHVYMLGVSRLVCVCMALHGTTAWQAKKGGFRETPPDLLCIAVLKGVLERTGVKPEDIGDIVFGNVLQPGAGAVMTRMVQVWCALLLLGFL